MEYSTPTYFEMDTAKTLGISLKHYHSLSRRERKLWYYYRILASKKEEYQYEKIKREHEAKDKNKSPVR